ncbi:putative TM2 domain-containing protein 3 [Hypsibius exemplaris]|uniref:TM2 domain-containing protein 3 n=1 Tax=Hypsibius exemplaris TaxID=2072580 RepID=A0A1W0W9B6_HYPEX|nr:putative TM2 domain-containing protein 3 [Hypsibius exemplaris]
MPSWFSHFSWRFSSPITTLFFISLTLIDGASHFSTPSDQASLLGPSKDFKGLAKVPHNEEFMHLARDLLARHFASQQQQSAPGSEIPSLPFAPHCSESGISCQNLSAHCYNCHVKYDIGLGQAPNCTYGDLTTYLCRLKGREVRCQGETAFEFTAPCRFCYQTEITEHTCIAPTNCHVAGLPFNLRHRTNCTVNHDVVCLGHRTFYKMDKCNFSSGYRWSTAMLLSVTVGGFGGDRFYLGHWKEGVGKLFSFGGLGVWTIMDILLIGIGYIRPEDGSLYIDL